MITLTKTSKEVLSILASAVYMFSCGTFLMLGISQLIIMPPRILENKYAKSTRVVGILSLSNYMWIKMIR